MERIGETVRRELGRYGTAGAMADAVACWPDAVGEQVAMNAWPARFARDGTLLVNTSSSAWAFELGQLEGEILPRAPRGARQGALRSGCVSLLGPSRDRREPASARAKSEPSGADAGAGARGARAGGGDRLRRTSQNSGKSCARKPRERPVTAAPSDRLTSARKVRKLQGFFHELKLPIPQKTSPFSRASSRSGCGRACTSARRARAGSISSSSRWSTTPSTRPSRAAPTRSTFTIHPDGSVTVTRQRLGDPGRRDGRAGPVRADGRADEAPRRRQVRRRGPPTRSPAACTASASRS